MYLKSSACQPEFVLNTENNRCVFNCGEKMYAKKEKVPERDREEMQTRLVCDDCPPGCLSCLDSVDDRCTQCENNFYMPENVDKCYPLQEGSIKNMHNREKKTKVTNDPSKVFWALCLALVIFSLLLFVFAMIKCKSGHSFNKTQKYSSLAKVSNLEDFDIEDDDVITYVRGDEQKVALLKS